jgi:hypothetical protein
MDKNPRQKQKTGIANRSVLIHDLHSFDSKIAELETEIKSVLGDFGLAILSLILFVTSSL